MKYKSSRLKEFGYSIDTNLNEARKNKEIIALADNQFLRSIRDITNRNINLEQIESWYSELDKLRKRKSSSENSKRIDELKKYINDAMFIPEYITIVMEHKSHYKYLFENGLIINFTEKGKETISKKYVRLSCSAGHARVSTVVFCEENVAAELEKRLNNGRDLNKKLAPSKFNAYFGLAGSATKLVTAPRICVVPDFESPVKFITNFVTETEGDNDDLIDIREINDVSNRFDGQGLVSIEMAKIWQKDLGLDYLCAQWGDRFNFMKGMLCTFDIYAFCETENNKNYMIKTSYKDEDGNNKIVDIRDYDVIVTESQFKLWDSFESMESYRDNCDKNGLSWGVTLPSPKEDKDILKMNYQFLQTLDLGKNDIEEICKKFVDWIFGISSENMYYTLLFLLGKNTTRDKIENYLSSSENYWVKCLIANHRLIKDEYFKKKIYDLIKTKIKNGCLGEIIVDGNYQTIVSDPYAMMQHVCGIEVTGLLGEKEYYSNYWNKKNVKVVDSMRAPLTFRSEHVKLNLVNEKKHRDWFSHLYTGIIVNVHGNETVNWSGSDFDLDLLATTSDLTVLKGVYDNELPVTYKAEKPATKIFNKQDLYESDLFAFGSIIGSITNKSTSAYALLSMFKENSKEHNILTNRLKMCTKLQSAQIDKAKIGKDVKGIPKHWITYSKIDKNKDSDEIKKEKEFYNSILLDKHPYFFKYLYRDTKNKFNKHKNGFDLTCQQKFGVSLRDLIKKENKTLQEISFIDDYYKFMPVIYSDCVMNKLCWHIESIDFKIKEKFKTESDNDICKLYLSDVNANNIEIYAAIVIKVKDFNKKVKDMGNMGIYNSSKDEKYNDEIGVSINEHYESFKNDMDSICSNSYELVNYLVKLFYVDKPSLNKDLLWNTYGDIIFENVKRKNTDPILFPFPNNKGEIEYLNKKYKLEEVSF